MAELHLMASRNGYPPPGLGFISNPEQGLSRVPKDFHQILPYHGSDQYLKFSNSFNLNLQQTEEWKSMGGLLDSNQYSGMNLTSKRPTLVDVQDAEAGSVLFSFGIAECCTKQEKILKLLTSLSTEVEGGLQDLAMLHELLGPQQSLVYPSHKLYLDEHFLDGVVEKSGSMENIYHPDSQLKYNRTVTEMHDILSIVSRHHLSKNSNSSMKTMLVPYYEWRRRVRANGTALELTTKKVGSSKIHDKSKEKKTSHKKKNRTRMQSGREMYCNSYLHACESLLSVIFNRKQQDKKTIILSLKKSGPQLPQLLTQFSASIAGIGVAVVLSIICQAAISHVPYCASKLLNTGLGLGLVWLSWAVNNLRDTVISISKNPSKSGGREEEMVNNLDRNLKNIYFRAAALLAVLVVRLV